MLTFSSNNFWNIFFAILQRTICQSFIVIYELWIYLNVKLIYEKYILFYFGVQVCKNLIIDVHTFIYLQSRFIRPAINDTYDPGMMYVKSTI